MATVKLTTADSSLASYIYAAGTAHYNVRDHAIDTITIHHAANGTGCSKGAGANTLDVIFASVGTGGSCQYGIDSNGKIGQMLAEKYRSWCSDSRPNDMRAVTIEVANCAGDPTWAVSDKALSALINLCTDICKRYGKKKMVWISDKDKALAYSPKADEMRMTLHKWFIATPCPGQYLISKMPYIAEQVTKKLGGSTTSNTGTAYSSYIVKITVPSGLTIRSGAGDNYSKTGTVPCGGAYTIVEEKTNGGQLWGKLKSGAGWICINETRVYAVKL